MKHYRLLYRYMLSTILPFLFCTSVYAIDPLTINPQSPWYAYDQDSGWHYEAGLGIEREPSYAGSDQYESEFDFSARAIYRTDKGHRYFLTIGQLGTALALSPSVQLLFFLEYEEGRTDEDDKTLQGLDEIDSTIEGQLMLAKRFGNMSIYGVLQPDLKGDANKGLVWFLGSSYDAMLSKQWRWSTRLDISGADSEYMRTEFGISAQEAQQTSYTIYQPDAGLKSATWGLSTEYLFNSRWSILANLETEYYFSTAADSPLIKEEGDKVTTEASIELRLRF